MTRHSYVAFPNALDADDEPTQRFTVAPDAPTQPSAVLPAAPRQSGLAAGPVAPSSGCAPHAIGCNRSRGPFLRLVHALRLWLVELLTPIDDVHWHERRVLLAAEEAYRAEAGMWEGLITPLERNLARGELEQAVYRMRIAQGLRPLTKAQLIADARCAEAARKSRERMGRVRS